ncbi:hypothetical protein M3Y97_00930000 [Aphelenchoides bicaudatus]|nr:hypothetical protein M3Y97_00930000 [Aphelenchoides bicaudatus]
MCANAMLDKLLNEKKLNPEDFRVGRNKAGILAKMEELRDAAISVIITKFQCACRGYLALKERQQRELVAEAVFTVQWNARKWLELRKYRLYMRVRPMLSGLQSGAQMKEMEGKLKEMEQKQKADQEQQAKLNIELAQQKEEFENLKANHANQKLMLERRQQEIKEANDLLVAEKNKHAELEAANSTKMKSLEKELQASREKLQTEHKQLKGEADRFRQGLNTMQLELAKQQDLNAQLVRQRKDNESAHRDHIDEMEQLRVRCDRLEDQRNKQAEELESCEMRLHAEKRQKEETLKEKRKLEAECKQLTDKLTLLQGDFKNSDQDCRRLEQEIGQWRKRAHDDANLISKLQANIRQLIQRIEDLENELELEQRGRVRAEKLKTEAQNELGELHERIAETNGQLEVQLHLNKSRAQELSTLQRELESKNLSHETNISDLCSMQWITLNNLRNLSQQAQFLENEANRVLDFRKVSAETMGKPLSRSLSVGANNFYKHNQTEYRP